MEADEASAIGTPCAIAPHPAPERAGGTGGYRAMRSLLVIAVVLAACTTRDAPADAERALAQRLLAPCCWRETLADHVSPTADEMRAELAARLGAGEAPAAIEESLVRRYGERIRALPAGGDPRWIIGTAVGTVLVGSLIGIGVFARRRRRRAAGGTPLRAPSPPPPPEEDTDRERLDDELLAVD